MEPVPLKSVTWEQQSRPPLPWKASYQVQGAKATALQATPFTERPDGLTLTLVAPALLRIEHKKGQDKLTRFVVLAPSTVLEPWPPEQKKAPKKR